MGAGNVARALHTWGPELDPRPMVVLIRMALATLDADPAPRFWGGWDELARAAGHLPPAGCARCRGCKACASPRKNVQRAITSLINARALTRVQAASRHRPAKYQLWLDGPAPVDQNGQSELFLGDDP